MNAHKDAEALPRWFVVNMCSRWSKERIERGGKPTRVHSSLASAYAEAARLADKFERGDFAIFECIGRVCSVKTKAPAADQSPSVDPSAPAIR